MQYSRISIGGTQFLLFPHHKYWITLTTQVLFPHNALQTNLPPAFHKTGLRQYCVPFPFWLHPSPKMEWASPKGWPGLFHRKRQRKGLFSRDRMRFFGPLAKFRPVPSKRAKISCIYIYIYTSNYYMQILNVSKSFCYIFFDILQKDIFLVSTYEH